MMGLGDVSNSVIPKPVLVSTGDSERSSTSRYFTPRRCHASHAVTGAIGVATAFALPGTVASGARLATGARTIAVLHPQGRIDIDVAVAGHGDDARIQRAALVRTARKILEGDLHLPDYVFSRPTEGEPMNRLISPLLASAVAAGAPAAMAAYPEKTITVVVPTAAGGGNDAMARTIAAKLGPLLGQTVIVDGGYSLPAW